MRIINRTAQQVAYELKGGPLRMTLSKCDLSPGEEEVWSSPYRAQHLDVDCELHVWVGGDALRLDTHDRAVVGVEGEPGAFRLVVDG